jgi:hypothetical protein
VIVDSALHSLNPAKNVTYQINIYLNTVCTFPRAKKSMTFTEFPRRFFSNSMINCHGDHHQWKHYVLHCFSTDRNSTLGLCKTFVLSWPRITVYILTADFLGHVGREKGWVRVRKTRLLLLNKQFCIWLIKRIKSPWPKCQYPWLLMGFPQLSRPESSKLKFSNLFRFFRPCGLHGPCIKD